MVPEGWERHPIGKLCRSIVPGRNKPTKFNGNIPWITTPDIQGRYIPSKAQRNYVSESTIKEAGAKIIPAGSVVISAVGDLGLTAISTKPVVLNQQLHAFVCPDFIKNEYLAYWLETQKPYMNNVASKTTIPYMNKANCDSIPVAYPPLPEQTKIAQILSTWDRAIETTKKLIENSRAQKRALMQRFLTRKSRLTGFFGDFERLHFKDVAGIDRESLNNSTPADHSFRYISLSDVETGNIVHNLQTYVFADAPSRARKKILPGDILMSTVRPNLQGFARVSESEASCVASTGFSVLSVKKGYDGDYLYHYLFSSHITGQLNALVVGSNYPAINSSDVKGLVIYCPSYEEQREIAEVLNSCDYGIKNLRSQLSCLKQEKKALMQQLLTGKRRVKVDQ